MTPSDPWPQIPYEAWRDTKVTLHMYTQVIGKLRLALSPPEPEWAHVALYLTARGLTTGPIPYEERVFQADFDLIDHMLTISASKPRFRLARARGAATSSSGLVVTRTPIRLG